LNDLPYSAIRQLPTDEIAAQIQVQELQIEHLLLDLVQRIDDCLTEGRDSELFEFTSELAHHLPFLQGHLAVWRDVIRVCIKHAQNRQFVERIVIDLFEPVVEDGAPPRLFPVLWKLLLEPETAIMVFAAYDNETFPVNLLQEFQAFVSNSSHVNIREFPFDALQRYLNEID